MWRSILNIFGALVVMATLIFVATFLEARNDMRDNRLVKEKAEIAKPQVVPKRVKLIARDEVVPIEEVIKDDKVERDLQWPDEVILEVPFTSQAPHSNWGMPYQEACEEASVIMVEYYWRASELNKEIAKDQILNLVAFEENNGFPVDTNAEDTAKLAKGMYNLDAELLYGNEVNVDNIKRFLAAGYPVIVPAAGKLLGNPNFTQPGPAYHMLVIIGYKNGNFITNDPGTRNGQNYEYSYETLLAAVHDWTGNKNTIEQGQRAMIVLSA